MISSWRYGYDDHANMVVKELSLHTLGDEVEQYQQLMQYDTFGRLQSRVTLHDQASAIHFAERFDYLESSGDLFQIHAGFVNNGEEDIELNPNHALQSVWRLKKKNLYGLNTYVQYGNGLESHKEFDPKTARLLEMGIGTEEGFADGRFDPQFVHQRFLNQFGVPSYDARGAILKMHDVLRSEWKTFGYDALGRVVSTTKQRSHQLSHERMKYDLWGNIIEKSFLPFPTAAQEFGLRDNEWRVQHYLYSGMPWQGEMPIEQDLGPNQLAQLRTYAELQNEQGDVLQSEILEDPQQFQYSRMGSITQYRGQRFQFGSNAARPERIDSQGGLVHGFVYDGYGKRVQKRIHRAEDLTVLLDKTFFSNQMVWTRDTQGLSEIRFVTHTPDGTVIQFQMDEQDDESHFSSSYVFRNYQGSVVLVTDHEANVLEDGLQSSDIWGGLNEVGGGQQLGQLSTERTVAEALLRPTDYGFAGHVHDVETGLVDMNARQYSPELGRFMSADSLVPQTDFSQSFNRYAYVYNNPTNLIDPTGHAPSFGDAMEMVNGVMGLADEVEVGGDFSQQGYWLNLQFEGTLPMYGWHPFQFSVEVSFNPDMYLEEFGQQYELVSDFVSGHFSDAWDFYFGEKPAGPATHPFFKAWNQYQSQFIGGPWNPKRPGRSDQLIVTIDDHMENSFGVIEPIAQKILRIKRAEERSRKSIFKTRVIGVAINPPWQNMEQEERKGDLFRANAEVSLGYTNRANLVFDLPEIVDTEGAQVKLAYLSVSNLINLVKKPTKKSPGGGRAFFVSNGKIDEVGKYLGVPFALNWEKAVKERVERMIQRRYGDKYPFTVTVKSGKNAARGLRVWAVPFEVTQDAQTVIKIIF